jgi:hypothetical protein
LAFAEEIAEGEDHAEEHGEQNEQAEEMPTFQHHFSVPALFRSHYFLPSAGADSPSVLSVYARSVRRGNSLLQGCAKKQTPRPARKKKITQRRREREGSQRRLLDSWPVATRS